MIPLYTYMEPFFFTLFPHKGRYRVLSRVPWTAQWVLVEYLLYIQECAHVTPRLPMCPSTHPFPLVTINK